MTVEAQVLLASLVGGMVGFVLGLAFGWIRWRHRHG